MIFEKVKNTIADITGIPAEEILEESHLYNELDADSLDMSQIILALENDYKIEIPSEEIAKFKTVADIVKHILNKTGQDV